LKEAAYIEIVYASSPLIRFEAFVRLYKMLRSGLKEANQSQPPHVSMARIASEEILKIAQGQVGRDA
jgi:hypothetical protein